MDNVTHTLIGITFGHVFVRKKSPLYKAALWTAAIGNNIPDIDALMKPFLEDEKLGYLVHHRGYTHTLLAALPLGLFAAWAGKKLGGKKGSIGPVLIGLGIASILLHIGADFCNDYGVHPFSPFYNHWFYGDSIFIIEPLIWYAILPFIFFSFRPLWGRITAALLGSVLFGLIWFGQLIPPPVALFITIWAFSFAYFQKKIKTVLPAVAGVLVVLTSFFAGSKLAKNEIRNLLSQTNVDSHIHEIAVTPAPSNPFCWAFISLSIDKKVDYVAKTGVLSFLPGWLAPERCYLTVDSEQLVPLLPIPPSSHPSEAKIHWGGEFRRPLSELTELRNQYCRFKGFLKFARFPVWTKTGDHWQADDLRYSKKRTRGLMSIEINSSQTCTQGLPPWSPPTSNL